MNQIETDACSEMTVKSARAWCFSNQVGFCPEPSLPFRQFCRDGCPDVVTVLETVSDRLDDTGYADSTPSTTCSSTPTANAAPEKRTTRSGG